MYSLSVFVSYNSTKALAVESIEKYVVLGHVASVFLWTNMKKLRNKETDLTVAEMPSEGCGAVSVVLGAEEDSS